MSEGFRSGFVAVVGRPNVGKSTLTNALVGQKVAITSPKPETTRHSIRGIVERDGFQVVLVDTPGLHRPRTLLGQRLNDLVHEALADVDAVAVCLPADQAIGPGDRFLANALPDGVARVAVVTKADAVSRAGLVEKLVAVDGEAEWSAVVPVSAIGGPGATGVEELAQVLGGLMPPGPRWYPEGEATDEPLEVRIAELIREAALADVRDELPHSVAVLVDEMDGPRIRASVYVERDSQKGIIIGKGGQHLKAIGSRARPQIEALVGGKVFLELHVKVAREWQRDPKALGRLGF
ncbi:MAG: GTPase Era [Bifidobacteriaceae bacterium]|jgi:GTP-binding protein Era|nr:GTPase Era [Bifidobacteriaceae bacterium]